MSGYEETHDPAAPLFFIDSYGERPRHAPVRSNKPANVRPLIDREPDSSEDEVVFSGRSNQATRRNNISATSTHQPEATFSRIAVQVVEEDIQFIVPTQLESPPLATDARDPDCPQDSYIGLSAKAKHRNKGKGKKGKGKKNKNSIWDDDSVFADYVRNVARNEKTVDSSSEDEDGQLDDGSEDELGLSKEEKAKFRSLSTLNVVEESSMLTNKEIDDDISDEDDEDSDTDGLSDLDDIISQIRRGASFKELEAHWANDDDMSLDLFEDERDVDFDIIDMQQDGPLKKKKKKKGKRQMDFGLSDSDLELQIENAWEKDRDKKAAKKREREKLRADGLLGKNKKKADRRGKDGIEGLKVELKAFLQSQADCLDLPPMKKHHRRVVHELANALALKSQSRGKGNARFPVLYKTGRTPNFNGKNSVKLDKIMAQPRFNLRQSTRFSVSEKASPAPKNFRQRQTTNTGASYLEGEVVGGSAPEIGVENKGRAMLEKMGWSSGTALGALNNKGILQPVAHVVKNTRAGLG